MARLTGAGERRFDGVAYEDLTFEEIVWPDPGHIERRSERKGPSEVDIAVDWTVEAANDADAWIGPGGSRSGQTVQVIGYSQGAGRILTIHFRPLDRPPARRWKASRRARRRVRSVESTRRSAMQPESSYREKQVDPRTERLRNEIEERWARGEETAGRMYRRRRRSDRGDPAVMLTVRVGGDWAGRLQAQAEAAGVPVSTLLQQWIEQRIEWEERGGSQR